MDKIYSFQFPRLGAVRNIANPSIEARWARLLFMLLLAWGTSIVWLAPHPPMVDLPQHAGQIALLRDLLFGYSPWNYMFRLNPLTPYLIGYGLALPLSMVMPIAAALKLLLSLAYLAYVFMCITLRRHFGGDARLDWLFLVPFFGFAFKWGFFTFLVSVPIGLFFIYLADLYAEQPTVKLGCGIFGVGVLLLMSHGLVFLFGLATGIALFFAHKVHSRSWANWFSTLLPYGLLLLICSLYFVVNQKVNAGMHTQLMGTFSWGVGPSRLIKPLIYTVGPNSKDGYIYFKVVWVALLLAVPWMLGLRIDREHKSRWVPFSLLMLVLFFVPDFAWNTAFLYQRFAIFMLPAYAWMFTSDKVAAGPASGLVRLATLQRWALPAAMLSCAMILGIHSLTFLQFRKEANDFDELIAEIEPNQRAIAIVLDQNSLADGNERMYAHYPVWYQAEEHGLVDFNFAWFPPQVVRYRPDRLPGIAPGFDEHPERFDWSANRGSDYTYFFVRHMAGMPKGLFSGASCPPHEIKTEGTWTVFKQWQCGSK